MDEPTVVPTILQTQKMMYGIDPRLKGNTSSTLKQTL